MIPVMKDKTPKAIPLSIVSARAGLSRMSSNIVLPAGTASYNKFLIDDPIKNNIGIAIIRPNDHLPNIVFGIKIILIYSILSRNRP